MRQELFSDIDPDIKLALQTRKKRIGNIPKDIREYSKSAFIRVFPLSIIDLAGNSNPKLTEEQTVERYTLGMQPPLEGGGVKDPLSSYENRYNRPIPGITGLSTQFEGFSGKGLVKLQLKGVINTLEDLDIYKPVLFTPGKYWMLEWGYIPHKGDGITDNLITIGDAYTLYAQKRIGEVFKLAEDHRKTTKGTAEIQVAVVNNYEYTLNAAGSFEFTVDFMGNSTLFRNLQSGAVGSGFIPELKSVTNPLESDAVGGGSLDYVGLDLNELEDLGLDTSTRQLETVWVEKEKTFYDAALDVGARAIGIKLSGAHYGELMIRGTEEKFRAATPNDFFRNLKTYIQECYKIGTDPETTSVNPWVDEVGPQMTLGMRRSSIYSSESRLKKDGIFYEQVPGAINQAGQKFDYNPFNNEIGPYVTWGWFEDNILNVVYGKNKDKSNPIKWESVDQTGVPLPLNSHKFLYTTTPGKLIIPGRMPDMLENQWDTEEGKLQKGMYTDKSSFQQGGMTDRKSTAYRAATTTTVDDSIFVSRIFGAYHPIVHDYIRISENALGFDTDIKLEGKLAKIASEVTKALNAVGYATDDSPAATDEVLYDQREVLVGAASDLRGSIRRLVLHYSLIQESFIGAATPIEGLRILLNKIENMGYKGFWDFDIFEVDDKIGVYEKNSLTPIADYAIEKVKEQAKRGGIDSKQQTDTPPPGEVFVFPTWNKDGGFVINQNLTVKLPTGKMLAMVYGQSLEGKNALQNKTFGDGDQPQVYSVISEGPSTPPQKINVDPGFQGSEISVTTSIGLSGIKSYGHISLRETWTKLKPEIKTKDKPIEYSFEGAKSIPIDGTEGSIFERGISIDAYGVMYDNVKQVMNYRLQKDYMKEGTIYKKITDRTTRVLDMAELSIKIQGLSGLNWGNQFHTDYIEQRFKDETVFFVSKVNHEISENNWTTEIVGGMRAIFKDDYVKEAVTLSTLENRSIDIKLSEADNRLIGKMRKTHHKILINSGRMNRIVKQPEGSIN